MGKTSIEWTGYTWNPIRGTKGRHTCVRISPGCKNCYAATMNRRGLGAAPLDYVAGADVPRLDEEALLLPLRWRKPRTIFVASMTDLFWEAVPDEAIDRVFAVMALASWHTFQVLTKRAERMRGYMAGLTFERMREWMNRSADGGDHRVGAFNLTSIAHPAYRANGLTGRRTGGPPLPNVWLGVSVEDQQRADERIPLLLQTPAAVRWVSYEPALGPIEFNSWPRRCWLQTVGEDGCAVRPGLNWIVVGGESGPGARPFDVAWARSVLKECAPTPCRVFVKQLGRAPYVGCCRACGRWRRCACVARIVEPVRLRLKSRKGGDPSEWPEDLRVREMPGGAR